MNSILKDKNSETIINLKTIYTTILGTKEDTRQFITEKKYAITTFNNVIEGVKAYIEGSGFNVKSILYDEDNMYCCIVNYTESSVVTNIVSSTLRDRKYLTKKNIEENSKNYCLYKDKKVDTWNCKEDVDKFFKNHNHSNGWRGLKVGNYITINDGTYNKDWVIAGFNLEKAEDGERGGIVFIPRNEGLTMHYWHHSSDKAVPYKDSDIHNFINNEVYNNLYNVLGDHIIKRNVTLGSKCDESGLTIDAVDTTAYLTLMSWCQLSGISGTHNTKFDDGEANKKLPIFDCIKVSDYANEDFWLRNIDGLQYVEEFVACCACNVSDIDENSTPSDPMDNDYSEVRPLMYLR